MVPSEGRSLGLAERKNARGGEFAKVFWLKRIERDARKGGRVGQTEVVAAEFIDGLEKNAAIQRRRRDFGVGLGDDRPRGGFG